MAQGDFRLAGWLVQPDLNRLSREDQVLQIEPKMMDVLVFLAANAGQVVSKIQITDAVWPDLFITESVITRSIAGLRRALGDDAKNPRFIETISKRGYRLIAPVVSEPADGAEEPVRQSPRPADFGTYSALPFVVGQWVRAHNFYGRTSILEEVLRGNRNWLWLLGTRRIGKTSVLKQLEFLAQQQAELGFLPVFWDLQGADEPDDLHLDFADALLDAQPHLDAAGISLDEIQADDCFSSLGRLRRSLMSKDMRLLLLCDEVEELIQLNHKDPSLLRKLRRALHSRDGIRSVLASSVKLWQLADAEEDTSPFLDGFTPPLAIGTLAEEAARQLIQQSQLQEKARPDFTDAEIDRIRRECGDHPYQIQLLCRRLLDRGDLETAIEEVGHDRAMSFFFSVDFELFGETERSVLQTLAAHPGATAEELLPHVDLSSDALETSLATIRELGLVTIDPEGRHEIASAFFRRWLTEESVSS